MKPLRHHRNHGVEIRAREVEAAVGGGDQRDSSKLSLYFSRRAGELQCRFHALSVVLGFLELDA